MSLPPTPIMDSYPLAHQALRDIYDIFNRATDRRETPTAGILARLEYQSRILDACMSGDAQAKQDAIVISILLEGAAFSYTPEDIKTIKQTYGDTVGTIVAFFAQHEIEATAARYKLAEYAVRAGEINLFAHGHPASEKVIAGLRNDLQNADPTQRALAQCALDAIRRHPPAIKPASKGGPKP